VQINVFDEGGHDVTECSIIVFFYTFCAFKGVVSHFISLIQKHCIPAQFFVNFA